MHFNIKGACGPHVADVISARQEATAHICSENEMRAGAGGIGIARWMNTPCSPLAQARLVDASERLEAMLCPMYYADILYAELPQRSWCQINRS